MHCLYSWSKSLFKGQSSDAYGVEVTSGGGIRCRGYDESKKSSGGDEELGDIQ